MELEQAVEAANRVHPPKSTEYEVRSVGASEHGERLLENSQTPLEFSLRPAFASWSHQDFPFQNVPVLLLVSAQPGPVTLSPSPHRPRSKFEKTTFQIRQCVNGNKIHERSPYAL
jgi:hypothetical protein